MSYSVRRHAELEAEAARLRRRLARIESEMNMLRQGRNDEAAFRRRLEVCKHEFLRHGAWNVGWHDDERRVTCVDCGYTWTESKPPGS